MKGERAEKALKKVLKSTPTIYPYGYGVRSISAGKFALEFLDLIEVENASERQIVGSYVFDVNDLKDFAKYINDKVSAHEKNLKKVKKGG